jgi:hypothetical protein
MMLTATPYDPITYFCLDADFRLPVNIPEDLITVGYETIRPSAPDAWPVWSRRFGKRQPRAEGGAGRDAERSLPRLLQFDAGAGKCLDGGLRVGDLDRDFERPFSVPLERSTHGSVIGGREKVDGEAADIEADTFRCELYAHIPAFWLRSE